MANKQLFYTGDYLAVPKTITRKIKDPVTKKERTEEEEIAPYLPDPDLIDAVNLAIFLERPLLLMGEPGCGKTRVAEAIAAEFYHDKPDFRDYLHEWHIKSTTKAKEGIYSYDAIRRLGEAQVAGNTKNTEALDVARFIEHGPLAKAYGHEEGDSRPVLLIDEIDKADLDFPNDLLRELDKGIFTIPELQKTIQAKVRPIVIITSNQEKPLPDAFLRRCVYHYIDPLSPDLLKRILRHVFYEKEEVEMVEKEERLKNVDEESFLKKAVKTFSDIREEVKSKERILGKNVSTSELIDWFRILLHYRQKLDEYEEVLKKKVPQEAKAELGGHYRLLLQIMDFEEEVDKIPFLQVLFKDFKTLSHFKKTS